MTIALYLWIYACLLGSLVACAARAWRYAKAPLHLRWEIYPVPRGIAQQAQATAVEILFLKGLLLFNRKLWRWSYTFHVGLYLAAGAGAAAVLKGVIPFPGLHVAMNVLGAGAALLIAVGAAGLLALRLTDPKLRVYTTAGDFFNLGFFLATLALFLLAKVLSAWTSPADLISGLATFNTHLHIPVTFALAAALAAALVFYIPLTHMSHFIAKFFTYHAVRWDDRPNEPAFESKFAEYLTYRPTWSAPHIARTGDTWAQIATADPTKGARP